MKFVKPVCSFLILTVLSFVMLWGSDKISPSGMALTRMTAQSQAPMIGQFYPATGQRQITIVTYDDTFLKNHQLAWPLSYQEHADWYLRLTQEPATRPKALLIDISFTQERKDPTLPALKEAFCTIQNEFNVPVFLAALPSPEDGELHVRSGLVSQNSTTQSDCFTLVNVHYEKDPLDGLVWSYPLASYLGKTGWKTGYPADPDTPILNSAAMTIAQQVAKIEFDDSNNPMALVWGVLASPTQAADQKPKYCGPFIKHDFSRLVPGFVRRLAGLEPSSPPCPYNETFTFDQIEEMSDEQLVANIKDKYLIVGADLTGYNDLIQSPVHGLIPGVYLHAMALDNLLTFGSHYKSHEEWSFPPSYEMFKAGMTAIFLVYVIHLLMSYLRSRGSDWLNQHHSPSRFQFKLFLNSLVGRSLTSLSLWLLRVSIQVTSVMILIAFLQNYFRIGMLPVVELVTMTLTAEGLNWMQKIYQFITAKPDSGEASTQALSKTHHQPR